jgi:hypothetical protein
VTGKKKRGKKKPLLYDGEITASALARFMLSESVPMVIPLPEMSRGGVDASARVSVAMAPIMPRLFCFATDSGPEKLLSEVASSLRGKALVLLVDANDEEEKQLMDNVGVQEEHLDDGPAIFITAANWQTTRRFEGRLEAGALSAFAMAFISGNEELSSSTPAASAGDFTSAGGMAHGSVHDLDAASLEVALQDASVWLILYCSDTSQGCIDFKPTWLELSASLKRVKCGVVSGVKAGGGPLLRLLKAGGEGELVMSSGGIKTIKQLRRDLKKQLKGGAMDANGAFLKSAPPPPPSSSSSSSSSGHAAGHAGHHQLSSAWNKAN